MVFVIIEYLESNTTYYDAAKSTVQISNDYCIVMEKKLYLVCIEILNYQWWFYDWEGGFWGVWTLPRS